MHKTFIILLFLLLNQLHLKAETSKFDSLITKGIYEIYNIKFNSAKSTFKEVIDKYPENPAGYFFDSMILWWKILLDTSNESFDEEFINKLESVIEMCNEILESDPDNTEAMFFKGGSLGFRGRLYAYRESWFNAALDGKDALPIVYTAFAADSTNPDIQLGFGIYNYYAAAVPAKYPAVKPLMIFFPEGDKQKGLNQIKFVAENGKYAKIESIYFLATSYYSFENDYNKALEYASRLTELFPDNPKFKSLIGRIWVKKNNYSQASIVFHDVFQRCNRKMEGFNLSMEREASYYIGVDFDRKEKLDSAIIYFENCVDISKIINEEESGFLINASVYLAKLYERTGNIELAITKCEEILELNEYKNSHEKAERILQRLKEN